MNWDSFKNIVSRMFEKYSLINFCFSDNKIEYIIDGKTYFYAKDKFDDLLLKISVYTVSPTIIYSPTEIQVFVEPFQQRYSYRFLDEELKVSDEFMSYSISSPSAELMLAFLSSIPQDEIGNYRRILPSHAMTSRFLKDEEDTIDLFDIIKRITKVPLSLKIKTTEIVTYDILYRYANSLLFTIAYNSDCSFKIIQSLSELDIKKCRSMPRRYTRVNEIESPKLFYILELTEQYNLAISSDDSFVKFIAYYHIMEYFFDDVYNSELISNVRSVLLHPGFSTKKPKEIAKLIDVIRKKSGANKDSFQGTELEALELTIKAFVSLEQLKNDLNDYDPTLIEYYRSHTISFSSSDTVDLNDFSNDKLPKKLLPGYIRRATH